nr:integrase arm-type DNA-binding domain-containing protein [uncultured Roseococcus sp.]
MLTDRGIKALTAQAKPFKVVDDKGLHVLVSTTGAKLWRYRYKFGGKEKLLALGSYPEVSLGQARDARDEARALLRAGKDPGLERKLRRAAGEAAVEDTFEKAARAWHARMASTWTSTHATDVISSLEAHVFPTLGPLPMAAITPPMVLHVLRAIEARPAIETAHRVRQRISAVFVDAIAGGTASADPAAVVKGALRPVEKGRQPAITELPALQEMLRRAETTAAHPVSLLALRLLALTVVRPGELRYAVAGEMKDLAGEDPRWEIPAPRMKMKEDHWVPLSRQAVEVLEVLMPMVANRQWLFPTDRFPRRPMSENTLGYLLNRAGYQGRHVPHGFRASFSTIMNEAYPADRAVIDLMLAHKPKDRVEAAYNRALYWPRRRELAQAWADTLLNGFPPALTLLNGPRR